MAQYFNALSAVFLIFALMAVGYVVGRLGWMTASEKKFVSRFVVNIAVPMNTISGLVKNLDHDGLLAAAPLVATAMMGIGFTFVLGAVAARMLRLSRSRWGVFVAMVGSSNTLFIGLPMSTQLFGEVSVPFVMLYYLSSAMFTQTLTVILVERSGSADPGRLRPGWLLKELVTKPPILGVFAGVALVLLDIQPPAMFMKFAGYMSNTVTPLALMYCGYIVYEVGLRNLRFLPGLPAMLVLRLLAAPMICTGMCLLTGVTGLERSVFIVESALPAMSQITVMAGAYDADEEYAAVGTCLSTLGCFITIPILRVLLG